MKEALNKKDPVEAVINKIEEDKNIEKKTFEYFIKENNFDIFKLKAISGFIKQPQVGINKLEALNEARDLEIKLQNIGKSYGLSEEEVNNYIKKATA